MLLTLSLGKSPSVDTLSWTAYGQPWTVNSWGFNVLLAYAHRLGDLAAVAVLGSVIVMLVAAILLVAAKRAGATPFAAAATLLLMSPALIGSCSVRPQLGLRLLMPILPNNAEFTLASVSFRLPVAVMSDHDSAHSCWRPRS